MQANSFIFFGLLLIPLIAFLIWMVRQDKKKNYLGLVLLLIGVVIAAYTIIRLDAAFIKEKGLQPQQQQHAAPKPSSFK